MILKQLGVLGWKETDKPVAPVYDISPALPANRRN